MYSDLRWGVRSALVLFVVFGGVWFFDEWQQGMPIPPGSWLELEDSASVTQDDLANSYSLQADP